MFFHLIRCVIPWGYHVCPAVETFTVALTHPTITKPIFRSFVRLLTSCRGEGSHQSRQNVIIVHGLKRAGYRVPNTQQVALLIFHFLVSLEPHEKPSKANGWVLTTWLQPGDRHFFHFISLFQVVVCYHSVVDLVLLWRRPSILGAVASCLR